MLLLVGFICFTAHLLVPISSFFFCAFFFFVLWAFFFVCLFDGVFCLLKLSLIPTHSEQLCTNTDPLKSTWTGVWCVQMLGRWWGAGERDLKRHSEGVQIHSSNPLKFYGCCTPEEKYQKKCQFYFNFGLF